MGLDMYLNGNKYFMDRATEKHPKKAEIYELGYWRKHPNLHGYIVQTFAEGVDDCREISLSREAIIDIMGALLNRRLPPTTGFFFGASENTQEEMQQDLEIFRHALAWLDTEERGMWKSISYEASW
jgi:hypothetical protein